VGYASGQFDIYGQGWSATLAATGPVVPVAGDVIIGDDNNPSGITLSNFVFKAEVLTSDTARGFLATPKLYCSKGTFYGQDAGLTQNAYIRFDPSFVSTENPLGFVGGVPDIMGTINWVPVAKDFTLTKGTISVPPTKANFWKFEMTNLAAEPYSVYLPQMPVVTSLMPPDAVQSSTTSSVYQGAVPPGTNTQIAMALGEQGFGRSTASVTPAPDRRVTSPTTTLVSPIPTSAQALAGQYFHFGYLAWAQAPDAPVDASGGVESYSQVQTGQIQQVGFFCGFITVEANRINIAAQIDTPMYLESFLDQVDFELL
jgi:hypothetical protein